MMMMMMMNGALIIFDTYSHLLIPLHANPLSPKKQRYSFDTDFTRTHVPMFFQQNLRLPDEEIQKQQKENTLEKDHPFLEHKKKLHRNLHFGSSWIFGTFKGSSLRWDLRWTWWTPGSLWDGFPSYTCRCLMPCPLVKSHGKVENRESCVFRTENQWGVDPAHQDSCHGWERHVKQRFHKNHECPVSVRETLFLFLVGGKISSLHWFLYIALLTLLHLHWFRA